MHLILAVLSQVALNQIERWRIVARQKVRVGSQREGA
jgi:hypothetical protein